VARTCAPCTTRPVARAQRAVTCCCCCDGGGGVLLRRNQPARRGTRRWRQWQRRHWQTDRVSACFSRSGEAVACNVDGIAPWKERAQARRRAGRDAWVDGTPLVALSQAPCTSAPLHYHNQWQTIVCVPRAGTNAAGGRLWPWQAWRRRGCGAEGTPVPASTRPSEPRVRTLAAAAAATSDAELSAWIGRQAAAKETWRLGSARVAVHPLPLA